MYMVKKKNATGRNISSFTSHRFRRNIAHYHYLIGELANAPSVSKTYIHHVINRKAHHTYKHLSTYTANGKSLKKARSAYLKRGTAPHS